MILPPNKVYTKRVNVVISLFFSVDVQYFVSACGKLAEKLLDHKAWWTPLADGKMALHVLMGSVCL
jgi:hypothetical protein